MAGARGRGGGRGAGGEAGVTAVGWGLGGGSSAELDQAGRRWVAMPSFGKYFDSVFSPLKTANGVQYRLSLESSTVYESRDWSRLSRHPAA